MKARLDKLSLREKRIVLFGGFFILIFLMYELIWSPIANKHESLRHNILRDQALLTWMKEADQHITARAQTQPIKSSTESLLSEVQIQLEKSDFSKLFSQLKQAEDNSVQVSFEKINFDQLMGWLVEMQNQFGWNVTDITVTKTETSGIVQVILTLHT